MLDRDFGVEIECSDGGYNDGCSCECSCYACEFCEYGCEESLGEDEDCSCSCECEECYLCRYGCEGECRGLSCDRATDLLYNTGLEGWCHDIHPDGSGVEIPSPILSGREGLRELQQVMRLLSDNGFDCTSADGLHVHHNAPEWAEDKSLVAHTIELWEENLPLIYSFVSSSRATNSMCASHKAAPYVSPDRWERFKASKDVTLMRDKFRALNIDHLDHTGTLELRLHQGTLDGDKAAAWVLFGQRFLEFAKHTYKRGEVITCAGPMDLLRRMHTSPKAKRTLLVKAAA